MSGVSALDGGAGTLVGKLSPFVAERETMAGTTNFTRNICIYLIYTTRETLATIVV